MELTSFILRRLADRETDPRTIRELGAALALLVPRLDKEQAGRVAGLIGQYLPARETNPKRWANWGGFWQRWPPT